LALADFPILMLRGVWLSRQLFGALRPSMQPPLPFMMILCLVSSVNLFRCNAGDHGSAGNNFGEAILAFRTASL
jgi:hypothetical protein